MTSPFIVFVLTANLLAGAPAQQAPPPPADAATQATLRQLEEQLADTLRTKSRADMERLLSETFLLRATPDADRDTWIKEALDRCWGDRFDIDDFSARVDGPTAVTSFVLTSHVNPETCEPARLRSLITDVWVKDGDTWRLSLRHSSAAGRGVATQFAVVPETPPRWVLLSELQFVATAGNTSTRTTGLASDLARQTDASSSSLRVAYVSSEADDVTLARATAVQARHGVKLREHVEVFGRGGYARDRFAGIDNRMAVDAGLAYTTGRAPRHQITLEGGIGFTSEQRVAAETLRFATGTGTARYLWQVATGTALREEVAIISDLGDAGNWRAANAATISVVLTQLLSLKVSNDIEYRNLPVFGFQRTDMRTAAAVVLTLRAR